ncbi:hypothetical protein [Deinococcus phoenicis]|uniref:hypothetical protein n=1 Tax=Deinococcus phoenicis TaxID=1476583 RepID=UPI001268A761|nr:hypothetical protein [Deinococcus phoenicis]
MPRKSAHYAHLAARAFLRGTGHSTVDSAIRAGARTNAEWCILLRHFEQRFWSTHNKKARRAVKTRHPVKVSPAPAASGEG